MLDRYPDLDPDPDEVVDAEVAVKDDALVKAFALGPGAELEPHEHGGSSNVFHVLEGEVVVLQADEEQAVAAPGVVYHDRGVAHGARNETDDVAVITATLAPFPA